MPWKDDPGLAPPSLTGAEDTSVTTPTPVQGAGSKREAAADSPAAAASTSATNEPDIPPAQPDALDVSAESALSAGAATRRPCELPNCGVVLSISGNRRWQIEVQMHDGSVQVFEQDYRPAFQIGDPVLVDGNAVFLWN